MELYVHIPFCARKCLYCDFASYAGCESRIPAYVDAVLDEARCRADKTGRQPVETVFLGGGTPSLLPAGELDRLLSGLKNMFSWDDDTEFTSEANPGTLTAVWLKTAVRHGLNRISMGMQALQPELLTTLGRIHTFPQVQESVRLCRDAGIRNINLDLMFGLPGQTVAHWRETLHAALSLVPQHLSCYGLIPEDNTPLKAALDAGTLTLPDEETERAMYDETLTTLAAQGFEQYEISNFALPGRLCRHNMGYWQQVPYLGLGASASSMLRTQGEIFSIRETNPPGLDEYMDMTSRQAWHRRDREEITHPEARFETMMLGLRTTKGVSLSMFEQLHHCSIESCFGAKLRLLEKQGLVTLRDGFWRLTRQGMDVQNHVLVELMDE